MAGRFGVGKGRRRFFPLIWLGSALSALLLVLGVNGSFSAFAASINNSQNNTSTGSLIMKETGPNSSGASTVCNSTDSSTNASTCSTINKYGNGGINTPLSPTHSNTTTVTIQNTGSINAGSFTLGFGTCMSSAGAGAVSAPGNACNYLTLAVYAGGSATGTPVIGPTTLGALPSLTAPATLTSTAATTAGGAGQQYTFVVSFPSATTGNDDAYMGLTVSQPMTWTFNQ